MNRNYNVLKSFIIQTMLLHTIVGIILVLAQENVKDYPIAEAILIAMLLALFNDYKITIDGKKIEFYSLLRKGKIIKLEDIVIIETGTSKYYSKALGAQKKLCISTKTEKYSFSIEHIDKDSLYKDLEELAIKYNFTIEHKRNID